MTNHSPIPHAPWWLPLAMATASLIGTGYMSYVHNDKVMAIDIAKLQTQREGDHSQIDRIESKLDKLTDLVTWALGKPK